MLEVRGGVWIFAVKVYCFQRSIGVAFQQILSCNLPGAVVFLSALPPREAAGKFLELDWLRFGVVFPAFGQGLFVIPDFFRGMRSVEEHEIGRDARVWSEDAVGEANDGVEIEVFE